MNETGFRPAKHLIKAIKNFPRPQTVIYMSMVWNSQSSCLFILTRRANATNQLSYRKESKVLLGRNIATAVWGIKEGNSAPIEIGVCTYDLKKYTCLAADWCRDGLGFSLTQKHCECPEPADPNCGNDHWKIVFAGSKATNPTQKCYTPIEGECPAAAYLFERWRVYTLGSPEQILAVGHKPLINIFNNHYLDTIKNPRLRLLRKGPLLSNVM